MTIFAQSDLTANTNNLVLSMAMRGYGEYPALQ